MKNLFKYTYKIVPTDVPNVVFITPTASTWAKAFAPSLIAGAVMGGLYAYGAYVSRQIDKAAEDLNNVDTQ